MLREEAKLMSVDFEKAFNRMDHATCLKALLRLGAKREDVELVCTFLSDRTMKVKVGDAYSSPRLVPGGSPQGSILGTFLFCAATNEFNELRAAPVTDRDNCQREMHEQPENVEDHGDSDAGQGSVNDTCYSSDSNSDRSFNFFRPSRRRILDDTEMSQLMPRDEMECELGKPEKWEDTTAEIKSYIDDINIIEKIRHSDAVTHMTQNKTLARAHAPQSQELFGRIHKRATDIGMRVNPEKTQILCMANLYVKTLRVCFNIVCQLSVQIER